MSRRVIILISVLMIVIASSQTVLAVDKANTKATLSDQGNGNYRLSCKWDGDEGPMHCSDRVEKIYHTFYLDGDEVRSIQEDVGGLHHTTTTKDARILGQGEITATCRFVYEDSDFGFTAGILGTGGWACRDVGQKSYSESAPQSFEASACQDRLDCPSGLVCSEGSCISPDSAEEPEEPPTSPQDEGDAGIRYKRSYDYDYVIKVTVRDPSRTLLTTDGEREYYLPYLVGGSESFEP